MKLPVLELPGQECWQSPRHARGARPISIHEGTRIIQVVMAAAKEL
jgi:hypothetical protein